MIRSIIKRSGEKQKYDRNKIIMATWQSLWAVSHIKHQFPALVDADDIARRAADIEVPHEKADERSSLWKEAERLAKIVETLLKKSNGSRAWGVEEIQDIVEQVLMAAGHEEAAEAYILYRNRQLIRRQGTVPSGGTVPKKQDSLGMSENALAAMAKQYLRKDKEGQVVETPKQAMKRVATIVTREKGKFAEKCLEAMAKFEFLPGGCYFRGAGNKQNGSLANCFVLPVEDSIEEIFDAVKWSAQIHQMGGGTGFNFSHLRPRGDAVKSGGLSSGPINFMKAFDSETQIVMQGGTHRGANMGILNVDHPDIFDFIKAKSVDGVIPNFNVSVGVFDGFMNAAEQGKEWALVNPHDQKAVQHISAKMLWQDIVQSAWANGDPGMIYLDAINRVNPLFEFLGPIESTNVCGEQPLHPFDVCNLGSINLAKFVTEPWWSDRKSQNVTRKTKVDQSAYGLRFTDYGLRISWNHLEEVTRLAVRFLDCGVDASTYPIPQIADMAHKLRRIGLGVMGWADMLAQLGIQYDSNEGIKLAKRVMSFVQEASWDESEKLAKEKGVFPLWEHSYFNSAKNPFKKKRKVRNVAVTTIAPTGTISMIADCSSGIEPYFALEYTKNVVEKEGLKYKNKYYEEAHSVISASVIPAKAGIYMDRSRIKSGMTTERLKNVFRTAHQISPEWHVNMQAAFQKYTDNAVSKTINFPKSATIKDVERAYVLAWKLGCKGVTVYRDGSREGQILEGKREEGRGKKEEGKRLAQSQLHITPLSQRAYQIERTEIAEKSSDGHCPECGAILELTEGCSLCRNCGFSKCSI